MRSLLTRLTVVALAFPLAAQFALAASSTAQSAVVVNRKLSGPMVPGGDAIQLAARNGRVAYIADQDVDSRYELYGVPADGSAAPINLSGTLVSGGDVGSGHAMSGDGSTVVYVADAEVDGFRELFSVPFDGSTPPLKLNGPVAANGVVMFRLSPDGTRALYVEPGRRLHSVPIGGGEPVFLATLNSLLTFEITLNSTHVLFSNPALYAVPIDGSTAPVSLSGSLTSVGPFEATPDGSRVAFAAVSSGVSRVYSQAIDGGFLLDLSSGLGTAGNIWALALSVDGTRVVYLGDTGVPGQLRLMSVPVDGSSSGLVLNGPMAADGDVASFEISPDGELVVYLADQEVNESFRLHRVRVDGSAPDVLLSTQNFANHNGYEIAPDGQHVVVRLGGLQSVPVAGGSVVQIAPAGGPFAFAAGGRRVVHFKPGSGLLVSTPITGGTSVPLSPALPEEPSDFAVDGSRVVYLAAQEQADVLEVYASWLDVQPTEHAPPTRSRSVMR